MGHFGVRPIRWAWFAMIFPALTLNYLGQGAMIVNDPSTAANPFFNMAPHWATVPLVVLATMATVIASQAVISGAYSVSSQATRLGLLPRLKVLHTSKQEGGQIFVPAINWILFVGVLMLIGIFQSSAALANAYGLAVTGTLLLTSVLFLVLAKHVWHVAAWKWWVYRVLVGGLELAYFSANLVKVVSGGWLPLLIASVIVVIMIVWRLPVVERTARGCQGVVRLASQAVHLARAQRRRRCTGPAPAAGPHRRHGFPDRRLSSCTQVGAPTKMRRIAARGGSDREADR